MTEHSRRSFNHLIEVVAHLRAPDGCPWDREQTPQSALPYLLEEAYEVAEAIDRNDPVTMKEELGDLLLQVLFQTQMVADTTGAFTIDDVIGIVTEKLIRRHPHVFGETRVSGTNEVLENWEKIKRQEKPARGSMLDGLPKALPALLLAYRLGQKTARVGFDWHDAEGILQKVEEEARELHAAKAAGDRRHIEQEFGDLLFTLANLGRFLDLDPEGALRRTTQRFTARFQWIERATAERSRDLSTLSSIEWDAFWQEAKGVVDAP